MLLWAELSSALPRPPFSKAHGDILNVQYNTIEQNILSFLHHSGGFRASSPTLSQEGAREIREKSQPDSDQRGPSLSS